MTPDQITILSNAVALAGRDATLAAERNAFRTQTDFIGRMNDSFSEIHELYDGQTESFSAGEDREDAIEAMTALAGLCVALVAILRCEEQLAAIEPHGA